MLLAFKPSRFSLFVAGVVVGLGVAWLARPVYQSILELLYRDSFFQLTERCDNAMRVHLVAKNRLDLEPSEDNVAVLKSAELGLLECQDYDLLRKKLVRLGLDENALSELTLSFAEDRAHDLQLVIKTHEFSY
ncbi:hypothetical protein NBRC116586_08060 [Pseudooceanicola nitratireducens]|uniref:TIGR03982 family His-Xaa-Ser system protein n=1 Tax=Pseudooceanicola nitratireducens TaxID=517719 RepID=UPI00310B56B2